MAAFTATIATLIASRSRIASRWNQLLSFMSKQEKKEELLIRAADEAAGRALREQQEINYK